MAWYCSGFLWEAPYPENGSVSWGPAIRAHAWCRRFWMVSTCRLSDSPIRNSFGVLELSCEWQQKDSQCSCFCWHGRSQTVSKNKGTKFPKSKNCEASLIEYTLLANEHYFLTTLCSLSCQQPKKLRQQQKTARRSWKSADVGWSWRILKSFGLRPKTAGKNEVLFWHGKF